MKSSTGKQLHDRLFRDIYSNAENCRDLLRVLLAEKEIEWLDLSTLRLQKESFLGPQLKQARADLILSLKSKKSQRHGVIFVLEHKSTHDRNAVSQMAQYLLKLHLQRKHQRELIVPVVVYHGRRQKWSHPLQYRLQDEKSWQQSDPEMYRAFQHNVVDFVCLLLNLNESELDQ